MTTVAIDIQPQFRFTCMAANATHFLLRPENMVNELNRQAALADKRVLIENVNIDPESICATVVNRNGVMFGRPSGFLANAPEVVVGRICSKVCPLRQITIMRSN